MPEPAPTTGTPRPLRPVMIVPDFDRVGGYELQALSLAAHDLRSGVPTFLLTNNPHDLPAREERRGVVVHRLPFAPAHHRNWAALFRAFLQFLDHHRGEYDVVHCHALTFLAACCVRIGRLLGKPTVVKVATERDIREYREARSLHFRLFFRWLRGADRLLCLSQSIQDEAIACGFARERTVVVPNGVDTARFAPPTAGERAAARAQLRLPDGTPALLTVGRLVERKAVDVLLRALARAPAAATARLFVVGDGDRRAAWTALAAELGLRERVVFAGEQTDVTPWLRAADAFVFPSRREGLPNALLEAMACGLPVAAMRIGGCTDVVGADSGLLVPADDVDGLARALDVLVGDRDRRAALARAARHRVESAFAFAVTAQRLQAVYAAAAVGKRGVAPPVTAANS